MRFRSRTYKVRCADGSVRHVYRRVEDALPLALQGWTAKGSAAAGVPDAFNASISGDVRRKVEGLVFALNEHNESLMLAFRSVYLVYESDPCANSDYLAQQITELNREQTRLNNLRLLVRAFAEHAASGESSSAISQRYLDIVDRLSPSAVVQGDAAVAAIAAHRERAEEWINSAPPGQLPEGEHR